MQDYPTDPHCGALYARMTGAALRGSTRAIEWLHRHGWTPEQVLAVVQYGICADCRREGRIRLGWPVSTIAAPEDVMCMRHASRHCDSPMWSPADPRAWEPR